MCRVPASRHDRMAAVNAMRHDRVANSTGFVGAIGGLPPARQSWTADGGYAAASLPKCTGPAPPVCNDFNMMVTRAGGFMLLAAGLIGSLLTACAFTRERMCGSGEYPVWSVRYPETGGACVPEGGQPPPGYATYPPGLVPEYFDEVITCSPAGKCVGGPLAIKCPYTYPAEPCRIAGRDLPSPSASRKTGN